MNFPKAPMEELFDSIKEVLKLSKSAISILQALFREKEATIEKLMRSASVSRRTAHEYLKIMRNLGLVRRKASEIEGRLRYVYSVAPVPEIIDVLKETLHKKLRELEDLQRRLGGERNE